MWNAVCNGIMLDFYQELATHEKPTISRSGLNSAYVLLPHNISKISCHWGSSCLCGICVIIQSFSCLCLLEIGQLLFYILGNSTHVCMTYNVWCVFHLMLTIDISLLWLFKQSPLNMHNTASPSRNKEDTSWEEGVLHQHSSDVLLPRWPTSILLDIPWL